MRGGQRHLDCRKLQMFETKCVCLAAGDKPELLYPEAAAELAAAGYGSTLDYVEAAAAAVLRETGLLPHINAGVMSAADIARWVWEGDGEVAEESMHRHPHTTSYVTWLLTFVALRTPLVNPTPPPVSFQAEGGWVWEGEEEAQVAVRHGTHTHTLPSLGHALMGRLHCVLHPPPPGNSPLFPLPQSPSG